MSETKNLTNQDKKALLKKLIRSKKKGNSQNEDKGKNINGITGT
jgi:hypothetical protein